MYTWERNCEWTRFGLILQGAKGIFLFREEKERKGIIVWSLLSSIGGEPLFVRVPFTSAVSNVNFNTIQSSFSNYEDKYHPPEHAFFEDELNHTARLSLSLNNWIFSRHHPIVSYWSYPLPVTNERKEKEKEKLRFEYYFRNDGNNRFIDS